MKSPGILAYIPGSILPGATVKILPFILYLEHPGIINLALAFEFFKPDYVLPDSLAVESFQLIPNVTARIDKTFDWGQYRHQDMLYFMAEYRHQFAKKNGSLSKSGFVTWVGIGSIGEVVADFTQWLPNFGVGYRFEVQPRMNVRLDIGFGRHTQGIYFNINEAF